jgi:hypothetical protein
MGEGALARGGVVGGCGVGVWVEGDWKTRKWGGKRSYPVGGLDLRMNGETF